MLLDADERAGGLSISWKGSSKIYVRDRIEINV
jgi:hypothetical protein